MTLNLNYRPEIDGLRAVAVLLVIVHHLGFSALSGGYIGVDVFFVISGYLITKIIAAEMQYGGFSLKNFYKRRIIRLAPAFFLVLAVTTLASVFVMLPAELLAYFRSVIFSTVFSANFFMWREVGGYFGVLSGKVPLLHLWSLAVEEQFYILWPLAFLGFLKLAKPKHLWVVIAILALSGLWMSEWGVKNYPAAAYYLMPTRAFALLFGALIAVMPRVNLSPREANGATLLGLALIMVPAFTYSTHSAFPGVKALVPTLGTALIIAFASHQKDWVGRLLAAEPLNFIGRISYPAYLWHWPLIVFLNIYLIEISTYVATGVLATTLLLSALTFWYVEIPAKRAHSLRFTTVGSLGFALPSAIFLSFSVFADLNKGWPNRFEDSLNIKSDAVLSYSNKIRGRCNEGNVINPLPPAECVLGVTVKGKTVDILLIGDSHANHYTGMIDVMAKDAGLRGYDITQSSTIYLPETHRFIIREGKEIEHSNFYIRNKVVQQEIKSKKFKYVVLGGSFSDSFKNEYSLDSSNRGNGRLVFKAQFEKGIEEIIESGAIPYIIKGNPYYSWEVQSCSINNQRFGLNINCNMSIYEFRKQFDEWSKFLANLSEKYSAIVVIDPALIMCDELRCLSDLDGVPLYRDGGHLNHVGSKLIGEHYLRQFGNPFKTGFLKISSPALVPQLLVHHAP